MKYLALLVMYAGFAVVGYGLYLLSPALGWIAGGVYVLCVAGWLLNEAKTREMRRRHGMLPVIAGEPLGAGAACTIRDGKAYAIRSPRSS